MLPIATTGALKDTSRENLIIDLSDYRNRKKESLKANDLSLSSRIDEHESLIQGNSVDIVACSAKITALTASLNEYIAKTDAILKNHYDALIELCEKHEMIDATPVSGEEAN